MHHEVFLPPPCCALQLSQVVGAIDSGCGEDYLFLLCPTCRKGEGVTLKLSGSGNTEWFEQFFAETGFRPKVVLTEAELVEAYLTSGKPLNPA